MTDSGVVHRFQHEGTQKKLEGFDYEADSVVGDSTRINAYRNFT